MKKNNTKNDQKEFSFINFYKQINKLSIKKKLGQDLNNKILGDVTHMNFSFKNLNYNNNINMIQPKKKLKFKTTKNTPNSSLKNIKLSFIDSKESKKRKDLLEKIEKGNKDLIEDLYIKKIKQAYEQKRSKSNNLFSDISKNKIKNQKKNIDKKLYKFDINENSNLNKTNYIYKSKGNININFIDDRVIFTNNYNNNIKDNIINNTNNIVLSSNISNLSNTNLNNYKNDSNKILLKRIENKYNNIIRNKIKNKKLIYNNMRNYHYNDNIKYYLKNNFSFNDKIDINFNKRINKIINNKILNSKEKNKYQINDRNYKKSFTPINSNNNSMNKPNNIKLKINDFKKTNKIFENLGNNLLNKKINFFSVKNSSNNLLNNDIQLNDNINNNIEYLNTKKLNINNYNININNYDNIKIINDKNIKEKNNDEIKKEKNKELKKYLKNIIFYSNNNDDKNEKGKKIISMNNDMDINISNQQKIINNNDIQLKEKEIKTENIKQNEFIKEEKRKESINEISNKNSLIKQNDIINFENENILEKNNDNNSKEKIKEDILIKSKDLNEEEEDKKLIIEHNEMITIEEPKKINKELKGFKEEDLLCDINKSKNSNSDLEEKSISSQSRDCLFYQSELDRLSNYIKAYFSKNNAYPESNIQFYLFGREIGHGAFGKVNLCLHIGSGHLVAMKTFVKKDSKYKETKDKLKNEVEVLSKLHHPFINQILDSFETETHFFIVMEYICGDLLSFIRKRNKFNENTAKIIFKQIIEGLKYIHKKNIIHRDIKLDNILIDTTNTVKICDFGVSRKISKGEIIFERCGTPAYIAPEIYKKMGYTGFQSDVWSAGVTLYYILSGNLPFKGSNIHELENAILFGEYKKIKDVTYEANDIIEKMLTLEPKERITINEILKHPWLKNVNLENRHKLSIFTSLEKKILIKYNIDYLTSSKTDLIENFTYSNLTTEKKSPKLGGNTKSVIYAPYNTCVNDDSMYEKNNKTKNSKSYLSKEEALLYNELEIKNEICKFGWRVRQANINYELSNNDTFDNGLIKSSNEEIKYNKGINKENSENDISLESVKDYEKIKIDKNILNYIEDKIGYDKNYLIKCLKKNMINYSTATYYLKYKEKINETKDDSLLDDD